MTKYEYAILCAISEGFDISGDDKREYAADNLMGNGLIYEHRELRLTDKGKIALETRQDEIF